MATRGPRRNWTPLQNKKLEEAVAYYDYNTPNRWEKIAWYVGGGKAGWEVKGHYEDLMFAKQLEADQYQYQQGSHRPPGMSWRPFGWN